MGIYIWCFLKERITDGLDSPFEKPNKDNDKKTASTNGDQDEEIKSNSIITYPKNNFNSPIDNDVPKSDAIPQQ